jgi:NAD+ kinase
VALRAISNTWHSLKNSIPKIKCIGLVANPEKTGCRGVVRHTATAITQTGRRILLDPTTARLIGGDTGKVRDVRQLARRTDLILVFGGDGTMLRVAREVAGLRTPVLGVNTGGLGFLTAASSSRTAALLDDLWLDHYQVEDRPLIEAARQGHARQLALNDFVISRSHVPRLIELEVRVDGVELTRYRCDGLIISSPTGSTAYSLAAGGAVVAPNAEVIALTPLSPHTLSIRPVIVSLSSVVQVRILSSRVETLLSADGQVQTLLAAGDVVTVRRSQRTVRLARLAGSSFFGTLREKLGWSGSTA